MKGKLFFQLGAVILLALFSGTASFAQTGRILTVEEMREDFDALRSILEQSHPNLYRSTSREASEKRWLKAKEKLAKPLSTNEFLNVLSPLVNQYNDGHTFMDLPWETDYFDAYVKNGGAFFPFKVWLRGDKLYITESWGDAKLEAGTEIVSINGISIKNLLKELKPLAGGDSVEGMESNFSRLFSFLLWQYQIGNRFDLKIRRPNQSTTENIAAAGINYDALSKIMFGAKAVYAYELAPEILVLEVNKMQSTKEVKKYIDETFAQIREKNYAALVIDLRKNSGGDSTVGNWVLEYLTRKSFNQGGTKEVKVSPYLLENNKFYKGWIPRLKEKYPETDGKIVMKFDGDKDETDQEKWIFGGKVIMLTSPQTYSSGFMMAETFKCYRVGQIVGVAPGSYRNLTGELMQFKLPKSKLVGYVSTAQYFPPCYQKAKTDFLQPDVYLEQDIRDLSAGKDTLLEYVKKASLEKNQSSAQ